MTYFLTDPPAVPATALRDPEFLRDLAAQQFTPVGTTEISGFPSIFRFLRPPAWLGPAGGWRPSPLQDALWRHKFRVARQGSFIREGGNVWIAFKGQEGLVPHAKGLDDIARLLWQPGVETTAIDMAREALPQDEVLTEAEAGVATNESTHRADPHSRSEEPLMDKEGMRDIRAHIAHLEAQPASPSRDKELKAVRRFYRSMWSIDKQPRQMSHPTRKARNAVSKRVRQALAAIQTVVPEAAAHLRASIKKGQALCYRPIERIDWRIDM